MWKTPTRYQRPGRPEVTLHGQAPGGNTSLPRWQQKGALAASTDPGRLRCSVWVSVVKFRRKETGRGEEDRVTVLYGTERVWLFSI